MPVRKGEGGWGFWNGMEESGVGMFVTKGDGFFFFGKKER